MSRSLIFVEPSRRHDSPAALSLNIIAHRPVKRIEGEPLTNCEECDAPLAIPNDAIQGEIVSCKDCGASYEVKKDEASGLITLKPAEKEQEDWGE
jgi:alpha-aminoadipate/glutamate carrier protein LysW